MTWPIWQINAFTNRPFKGNPAAVCMPQSNGEDQRLQQIAIEMNLSETAFLYKKEMNTYHLRWFTISEEEELCGHATLAAAHVLWEEGDADRLHPIKFFTRSGLLEAYREGNDIRLDFPKEPITLCPIHPAIKKYYGSIIQAQGYNRLDHFLELSTEEDVLQFLPEEAIKHLTGRRGIIISSPSTRKHTDIVSRFFAPTEDPVTGSAHCAIGPYWAERIGRETLRAYQASSRGGTLHVVCHGKRVHLIGQAVTIWKGRLTV
ncbi:PhzF family phenazine biosynthesis protein [Marininema halotolerans]|uniref:Phenazine biosynthesis protein PhzF family n=1 Tax=Marininema halotolerans TaxID=1155944 RepID=A0A1I6SSR6_9BACL|nr:PhzF family phenazine biosynthesis protein [Marininema halotolerans]SFS79983.1 phenazine biosynthesis protein PhzF family [Marininema halotolerans]